MTDIAPKRLVSACIGMDLCWLYAWCYFIIINATPIPFPLISLGASFFGAYFIALFFKQGGYRLIWSILAHVAGVTTITAMILFNADIIIQFKTLAQWFHFFLLFFMTGLFWYKGFMLLRRQMSYRVVCNHFDLGLSLFFALFLIKLLFQYKGGIKTEATVCFSLMLIFFFFGMTALFTGFNPKGRRAHFINGFKGYGILFATGLILIFICVTSVFFFYPSMTAITQYGFDALQESSAPLAAFIAAILKFLFASRTTSPSATSQLPESNGPGMAPPEAVGPPGLLETLLINGLVIVFLVLMAIVLGFIIYLVIKRLMRRQPATPIKHQHPELLKDLIHFLCKIANAIKMTIRHLFKKINSANDGFTCLMAWGRKSGLSKQANETPAEYATRLQHHFSDLKNEIHIISSAFQLNAYAGKPLAEDHLHHVRKAYKRMKHPAFWWKRILTTIRN